MEPSIDPSALGGKVGARIAGIVHKASMAARVQSLPIHRQLVATAIEDFYTLTGGELSSTIGPLYRDLAKDPSIHPDVRNLLNFVGVGHGQFATMLGNTITGSAVGAGLGSLITNSLAPAIGRIIALAPNIPMTVADAVNAEARNLQHGIDMAYEAAQQGINSDKFDVLVDLARPRPDVTMILDMLNRGIGGEGDARAALVQLGYPSGTVNDIMSLRHLLIDPARLADLVTFGVLPQDQARNRASQSGMLGDDFDLLVAGNGEPPSTQELLFAYRRGVINRDRLYRGIQQGPLRNEWFDVVESFGQVPMSTSDAISAAVQGHLSTDQARTIATQNGLIPSQFDPLLQTAGSPPGPQEMLDLLNRGLVSEADVTQALSESRLKNKYIPLMLKSRFKIPTEPQIVSMLRKKIITAERAKQLLTERGFLPDIADALIAEALIAPATKGHELPLSDVRTMYHDRLIDKQQAHDLIVKLGYTSDEADALLTLADYQRSSRVTRATVTRIHHAYIMGLMTPGEASMAMDAAGIDATSRDENLAVWAIEKTTVRRTLTEAQVLAAAKKGIITVDDATQRLSNMGYPQADIGIILAPVIAAQQP